MHTTALPINPYLPGKLNNKKIKLNDNEKIFTNPGGNCDDHFL